MREYQLSVLCRHSTRLCIRSKHESDRLHKLTKGTRKRPATEDDDLPSIHSHDEDEGLWDSDIEGYSGSSKASEEDDDESDDAASDSSSASDQLEVEDAYALKGQSTAFKEQPKGSERLPVKLSDGKIKKRGFLPAEPEPEASESDDMEETTAAMSRLESSMYPPREDISTGARFGRPAVTAVIGTKSRKARIQAAKEQLASICQEIIADPENSVRSTILYQGISNLIPASYSLVSSADSTHSRYRKLPLQPTPSR